MIISNAIFLSFYILQYQKIIYIIFRPIIDGIGNQTLQIRDLVCVSTFLHFLITIFYNYQFLLITFKEWDVEGYHLWFIVDKSETFDSSPGIPQSPKNFSIYFVLINNKLSSLRILDCIYQMQFVKSASSVNPNAVIVKQNM